MRSARGCSAVPPAAPRVFLIAISPSAVFFGRFFISDTPMVFYSVAAVLAWVIYFDTGSRARLRGGSGVRRAGVSREDPRSPDPGPDRLDRLGSAPLVGAEGSRIHDRDRGAIAATALWYWHADAIYHRTGLSQAIWHPSGNYGPPISAAAGPFIGIYHWATLARLQDPAFYSDMTTRIWALHLTPGGFVLALFALLVDVARAAPSHRRRLDRHRHPLHPGDD